VVVSVAIGAGVFLLGSPLAERARRLDVRRVTDLAGISRGIDLYWTRTGRLPASLEEVRTETGADVSLADPATSVRYEFTPIDGQNYELCGVFDRPSDQSDVRVDAGFWTHRAGRHCFRRAAEKVR
jgi:hypothetical protein